MPKPIPPSLSDAPVVVADESAHLVDQAADTSAIHWSFSGTLVGVALSEILIAAARRGHVPPGTSPSVRQRLEEGRTDGGYLSGASDAEVRAAVNAMVRNVTTDEGFLDEAFDILGEDPPSIAGLASAAHYLALMLLRHNPDRVGELLAATAITDDRRRFYGPTSQWWSSTAHSYSPELWTQHRAVAGYDLGRQALHRTATHRGLPRPTSETVRVLVGEWRVEDIDATAALLLPAAMLWLALHQYATNDRWSHPAERPPSRTNRAARAQRHRPVDREPSAAPAPA